MMRSAERPPRFRVLTVVDQWSRQSPVLEVGVSLTGQAVREHPRSRARDRRHGAAPRSPSITARSSPPRALEDWAYSRGVQLDFIRPGKPVENAYVESFNGRLRDECLNVHQFVSMADARTKIEAWRLDYNEHRPHGSLGHLTPNEFVSHRQETRRAASGADL